ncbi:MAG: sulfate adenylyltransferase subunit 1 [Acidimicrobiales bacterium]
MVADDRAGGGHALLKVATAGSVDDGKSTLIGRLLYDTKSILEDQLAAVERHSAQRGHDDVNLALLTDGLRSERDQGITIDVAYRYFATPRRSFVLIDTPGHVQYTPNMVTGASNADVAVVLIDARKGVLEQSRRHASIAALLAIPHVVLAVNKMDLVGWDQGVLAEITDRFGELAAGLGIPDVAVIPLSALAGDNVVEPSTLMPWYDGPTLLEYLETLDVASSHNLHDPRFPVQYVILSANGRLGDERRYAGEVAGGVLRPGDPALVLPSGLRTTITELHTVDGPLAEAGPGQAVSLRLADELDVERGDMVIVAGRGVEPMVTSEVAADVCWFVDRPLVAGARYTMKHTTRSVRAVVTEVTSRLDLDSLTPHPAQALAFNEIGEVTLHTSSPLVVDPYLRNRVTGRFILIDEATNSTAGAGMILPAGQERLSYTTRYDSSGRGQGPNRHP